MIIHATFRGITTATSLSEHVPSRRCRITEHLLRVNVVHSHPKTASIMQFISILLCQAACMLLLTLVVDKAGLVSSDLV